MHFTLDDSVRLLSSNTIQALPVNVNEPALVGETPLPSIDRRLHFIIAKNRQHEASETGFWVII